jgi:hypothetical protein
MKNIPRLKLYITTRTFGFGFGREFPKRVFSEGPE